MFLEDISPAPGVSITELSATSTLPLAPSLYRRNLDDLPSFFFMLHRFGRPLSWQLAQAPLKNPSRATQTLNLPRPFAQLLHGTSCISPRVASRHPNLICFLRESPPVSCSAPGSTPSLQGSGRFSGIDINRSSIVVGSRLDFMWVVRGMGTWEGLGFGRETLELSAELSS